MSTLRFMTAGESHGPCLTAILEGLPAGLKLDAEGISKEDLEPRVGKPVATVPQIFLDNQHVGGCTDFQALVKAKFGIEV